MARTKGIVLVIDRARSGQPYVIADFGRAYRQISPTEMEGLPVWEAQLVTHLLQQGEFVRDSKSVNLRCGEYTNRVFALDAPQRGGDVR